MNIYISYKHFSLSQVNVSLLQINFGNTIVGRDHISLHVETHEQTDEVINTHMTIQNTYMSTQIHEYIVT